MQVLNTSSADGTALRLGRWGHAGRDVLIVHGLAEHARRYEHVASALVERGFRVTVVELRGHGHSAGQRGHVERWRRYTEDVWAAAGTLEGSFAIVAHSMGGLVVAEAMRESMARPVIGIALSNPLFGFRVKPPRVKLAASSLLSRVLPRLNLSNELDASGISRDKAVVHEYEADPLVFGTITPRWFTEMGAAIERAREAAPRMTVPLLLMVSDADPICDPDAARAVEARWGGPHTRLDYPPMMHEIFNEIGKEGAIAALGDWLLGLKWDDGTPA